MRYKHVKTGAVIDSSFKIIGKAWKLVEENEKEPTQNEETPEEEYTEEEIDLEAMTKEQLVKFAKEHEVEVNENSKKADIIETIAKAFE